MGLSTKQVSGDHDHQVFDNWSLQSPELPKPPPTARRQHHHQQPDPLNCPRCDSTNTKFCYYNNYNKSQPRHFCKACKRHWTKGGTLRNVPVGGCRKNKRHKPPRSKVTATSTATTAAISTSQIRPQFSNLSDSIYQAMIPQRSFLNDNAIFNMENFMGLPPNDQSLQFSLSSNSDSTRFSNIGTSFQSLSGYKYNEKGGTMEESIITSIMAPSDVCPAWELAAPISTSGSVMELPISSYWNWSDFDTTLIGSAADLNIPWDETEIKP